VLHFLPITGRNNALSALNEHILLTSWKIGRRKRRLGNDCKNLKAELTKKNSGIRRNGFFGKAVAVKIVDARSIESLKIIRL